jgi:hypothetical protein
MSSSVPITRRQRTQMVFNIHQTFFHYENVPENNENKKQFFENLALVNLNKEVIKGRTQRKSILNQEINNLPPVPQTITNKSKKINQLEFDERSNITEWFDNYTFNSVNLKAIDFQRFISNFSEDDYKNLKFIDIFGFDVKEYENLDKKFRELKALFKDTVLDKQLYEYFKFTRYEMDESKENMKAVHQNFDKIDRVCYFNDSIKFFMKGGSKEK